MSLRVASAHSHRAPSAGGNGGHDGSLEERVQRLLAENMSLKQQRNELEAKLTAVKTKFRRLLRDIKMTDADVERITGGSVDGTKDDKLSTLNPNHQAVEISMLNQKVAALTAQRDALLQQAAASSHTAPASSATGAEATLYSEVMQLKIEKLNDQRLLENAKSEVARLQQYVAALQQQQQQHHPQDQLHQYKLEIDRLRERTMADARAIENLVRERDSAALQVRLLQEEAASRGGGNTLDPLSLIELQSSINDKSTQITVLTNRLAYTQSQVNALRGECERLVGEMRAVHSQHAEVKKKLFDAEHSNAALAIRCDRMNELEQALHNKNEELLKAEQELLKLVDRLQGCSRETELQVRREMNDRINELETLRDEADKARRQRERDLVALQHELADAKRRGDIALADLDVFRKEAERLQGEKQEQAERSVLFGTMSTVDLEDDVHKAMAMASIRRRQGQSVLGGGGDAASTAAEATLDLWEGMAWNDEWEAGKLREALATAALNLELAETRCSQLTHEAVARDAAAKGVASERDALLEENIEMRRRITNVQTLLAKKQLDNYHKAVAAGQVNTGSISFAVTQIECDSAIQQMPDGSMYNPTLFMTLDGLDGYHTMISKNFYAVSTALDIRFVYEPISIAETTLSLLQRSTFVFQLHQSFGLQSVIVAVGQIEGGKLLACRDGSALYETVTLINEHGDRLGSCCVAVDVRNLLLPVMLERPLSDMLMPADAVRTALVALRAVRSLRIQVFKATNLALGQQQLPPRPYVFMTALPVDGVTCLPDTTIAAQDSVSTANPIFDVTPRDFPVVLDRMLVQFIALTRVVFVVFDHHAQDVQAHIGMVEVSLRPLLRSPAETMLVKEALHPSGELEVGFSWVSSLV